MKLLGLLAMAAASAASGAAAQPAPQPIEVMVLGTYHFGNPGLDLNNMKADDVTQPRRQAELEALAAALAQFRPTKVMIEAQPKSADLVDSGYARFTPAALGTDRNEIAQIGYRIAHRLGHKAVYAIDEQPGEGEPDYFPFDKVGTYAKDKGMDAELGAMMAEGAAVAAGMEEMQKTMTIGQILAERNRPATTAREQTLYYGMLSFGDTERQPGAELNAMWYMRNAKIFGKLMQAAKPGDRILVVYGSGHNYWLRHFAQVTPGYVSVDPVPYLAKASGRK
jgi:hypothetical protein